MSDRRPKRLLFLIDRIEDSSYPVTETGYALMHRAFLRAEATGDEIYVAYPDTPWTLAHRVRSFCESPYRYYQSQREQYRAGEHIGSPACHEQSEAVQLALEDLDAIVWRQETGAPEQMHAKLRALQRVEPSTLVYQSPRLALDPRFGSKVLPGLIDPRFTPKTLHTSGVTVREKVQQTLEFIQTRLGAPRTVIAKPLRGDNGVGIHVFGRDPRTGETTVSIDDRDAWSDSIDRYGDLVVQEYIESVRAPSDVQDLAAVPHDRRDFGEIRFILIDGEVARLPSGEPCRVARRVPVADSLVADSGISHPTSLSEAEVGFLTRVGALYRQSGIHFGGGDLIRTPDPERPFVFTDAAQSVCGHAVVTGALNGAPYSIVDRVLDSIERQIALRHEARESRLAARTG